MQYSLIQRAYFSNQYFVLVALPQTKSHTVPNATKANTGYVFKMATYCWIGIQKGLLHFFCKLCNPKRVGSIATDGHVH